MKDVTRNIRIFSSQVRILSISGIASLFIRSLFKTERISIYVKELDGKITSTVDSELDNSVIKGNPYELEQVRKNMEPLPWEFSCNLYDGVKDFFIYRNNGAIGHISWIYYKNDPNRIIDLGIDEGEIKYSLTLPQCRGKGIYPATLIKVQRYLKEHGYRRVYICAEHGNLPSIKGIEKAGFKFVTSINLIKIAGVQLSKKYAASH